MTIKEHEKVIKMLIKNHVEEYETEGLKIKLSPLAFVPNYRASKSSDISNSIEDDLYYSASNFKGKK